MDRAPSSRRRAAFPAIDAALDIDALMAQPIKRQPAVVVVGDPDVAGYTPAPGFMPPAPGSVLPEAVAYPALRMRTKA